MPVAIAIAIAYRIAYGPGVLYIANADLLIRSSAIDVSHDHNRYVQGPDIAHMSASDLIHWIGGSEFLPPPLKSGPLPLSDAISLYKGFLPFLGDFASFYKEQRASSLSNNFCILSPFFPIQVAVDLE